MTFPQMRLTALRVTQHYYLFVSQFYDMSNRGNMRLL